MKYLLIILGLSFFTALANAEHYLCTHEDGLELKVEHLPITIESAGLPKNYYLEYKINGKFVDEYIFLTENKEKSNETTSLLQSRHGHLVMINREKGSIQYLRVEETMNLIEFTDCKLN